MIIGVKKIVVIKRVVRKVIVTVLGVKMENLQIPDQIKELIGDEPYYIDDIGKSESQVILFSDKVLKIQEVSDESVKEIQVLTWLEDKLSVPEVLVSQVEGSTHYLLMSKIGGNMACDDIYMANPEKLVKALATALRQLWNVDLFSFKPMMTLAKKLEIAEYNVLNGKVDMADTQPATFGANGFEDPHALLRWLVANQPDEELVFSHGDMSLPNVFFKDDHVSGFIDLGLAGVSDKWQDIAIVYRSLVNNFAGVYGGKTYAGFKPEMLFEALDMTPDWDKLRYYILLDELF